VASQELIAAHIELSDVRTIRAWLPLLSSTLKNDAFLEGSRRILVLYLWKMFSIYGITDRRCNG